MPGKTIRIIGIDPGLRNTGWGIISLCGSKLTYIADGTIRSNPKDALAERLLHLHDGLAAVIREWQPQEAAVEETFVNKDARATLKLGAARGIALLAPARAGLRVGEYAPNMVKKTVVGSGHAGKEQITAMIKILLPKASPDSADSADALAIAICHSQHRKHLALTSTHT
ncbi:MAG TPA: crossover junction endodeoxyribonuclease RuvC [Rhizobiales bacterium]|nr:crossover junction endodeoxyribonuclease RuvC [Hyphomicrobiales bacterium]